MSTLFSHILRGAMAATLLTCQAHAADFAGLPALRDIDGNGTPDWEDRTFILDDETLPTDFLDTFLSEST